MLWELYDRLIEGIPEDWKAEEIVRGSAFTYVKSGGGIGVAGLINYDFVSPMFVKNMEGAPLREVAECPYGIITTNRKSPIYQGLERFPSAFSSFSK